MADLALLDNVTHAKLKVDRRHGAAFGDNVNQVVVFPTEYAELQREYPIFFRQDENGAFLSIVILGFDKGENLFLEEDGWNARYVPAVQQCGPFKIAVNADDPDEDPKIQIDLEHPRVTAHEGEDLFLPQGGHTPYLNHIIDTLQRVHLGLSSSPKMFEALQSLSLIEPVTLELNVSDAVTYSVPDLFSINEEAFLELDAQTLSQMQTSGLMALCHWVLSSRGNVNYLLQRKILRQTSV